jgi:hypothetical protein
MSESLSFSRAEIESMRQEAYDEGFDDARNAAVEAENEDVRKVEERLKVTEDHLAGLRTRLLDANKTISDLHIKEQARLRITRDVGPATLDSPGQIPVHQNSTITPQNTAVVPQGLSWQAIDTAISNAVGS